MNNRKPNLYYYYPPQRNEGPGVYRELDRTNKTLSRVGLGLGVLAVGGYFLWRKVKDLNSRMRQLESGKRKEG